MKKVIISLLIALSVSLSYAQTVASLTCDFEDDNQNSTAWSLRNGPMANSMDNSWYIGTAANNGGKNGLYISADKGQTAYYTKANGLSIAVMDVYLAAGTYDLSFDWRAMGNTGLGESTEKDEGLYVCWAPDRDFLGDSILFNNANNTSETTNAIKTYALTCSLMNQNNTQGRQTRILNGSATWRTAVAQVNSDGTHRRLVFVWVSNGNTEAAANPGASVDNIMIVDSRNCPKPTDLKVEKADNQQVVFTWSGTATEYEVKCFSYFDNSWQTFVVQDTFKIFHGLGEGTFDFYVSSLCDDGVKSITSSYPNFFLYYPENHCIDYLTLDSSNCFIATGTVNASTPVSKLQWTNQKVDFGYESKTSRHTIHNSPIEYDPRTCGQLKTVPDGEIASVRLGNWNTGSQSERVEFKFPVNADITPVLILKYAVVLQKPGAGCNPNPGFLLRVLDKTGQLVSNCASADFDFKAAADAEWNTCYPPSSSDEIRWKDWTTIGVNLAEFDGDTLTIQLTTYDCGAGGHYGYAYFTLGCSDGKLTGITCNNINTQFIAPEGFKYRWHKYGEQCWDNILSNEQIFEVSETDTCHYEVDLMFPEDTTCYFSLTACSQPFTPTASAKWQQQAHDCLNEVQFTDLSHVKETSQITGEVTHTNRPVDRVKWEFPDGTISYERNPIYIFPNEGGPMNVKLTAYLSTCEETYTITDVLPAIGERKEAINVQQCYGTEYHYTYTNEDGKVVTDTLTESGNYEYMLTTIVGCDSIFTIHLEMVDTIKVLIDSLIMRGESCEMGGVVYSETGIYVNHSISAAGCDSVTTLNLKVYDYPIVEADTLYVLCGGEESFAFTYHFKQGIPGNYSVDFASAELENIASAELESDTHTTIYLPSDLRPNIYQGTFTFLDTLGLDVVVPFIVELRYPSDILTQRWSDVLAVKNSFYNGGYDFTSYQWYKNGEKIEGATGDYFYTTDGLDMDAEYAVMLVRADDEVELMTCAVVPHTESVNDIPGISTLVKSGQPLRVSVTDKFTWTGVAMWITPQGVVLMEQNVIEGEGLVSPDNAGVYLLIFRDEDNNQSVYRIIVTP